MSIYNKLFDSLSPCSKVYFALESYRGHDCQDLKDLFSRETTDMVAGLILTKIGTNNAIQKMKSHLLINREKINFRQIQVNTNKNNRLTIADINEISPFVSEHDEASWTTIAKVQTAAFHYLEATFGSKAGSKRAAPDRSPRKSPPKKSKPFNEKDQDSQSQPETKASARGSHANLLRNDPEKPRDYMKEKETLEHVILDSKAKQEDKARAKKSLANILWQGPEKLRDPIRAKELYEEIIQDPKLQPETKASARGNLANLLSNGPEELRDPIKAKKLYEDVIQDPKAAPKHKAIASHSLTRLLSNGHIELGEPKKNKELDENAIQDPEAQTKETALQQKMQNDFVTAQMLNKLKET